MARTALRNLAEVHGQPAVSILCPLDRRRPGNVHDAALLEQLRDRAAARVRDAVDARAARAIVARIDAELATIDLGHPAAGVGLFVSPELSTTLRLDAPVGPRVVVGSRFAIGDVVHALARAVRGRILVLSLDRTRCIDVTGDEVVERVDCGFPVRVSAPTEADTPHRDFPLAEHEHAEAARYVFRAVERALDCVQRDDERPVVVMGVERDLAYFEELTGERLTVAGHVRGNYEFATPEALAEAARPVLAAHDLDQRRRLCDDVREAIGTRAVAGIGDTWRAARDGRGHLLVVEDGYRVPACVIDDRLITAEPVDSFDAVEDTVEEVVRHGGDVVVVPEGWLADVGHVALLTRF